MGFNRVLSVHKHSVNCHSIFNRIAKKDARAWCKVFIDSKWPFNGFNWHVNCPLCNELPNYKHVQSGTIDYSIAGTELHNDQTNQSMNIHWKVHKLQMTKTTNWPSSQREYKWTLSCSNTDLTWSHWLFNGSSLKSQYSDN